MRRGPVSRSTEDLLIVTIVGALLFAVFATLGVFGHLAQWLHDQELVDDLLGLGLVCLGGFAYFAWRRWRELQAARSELRIISGVIPICAWCRKARDEAGAWMPLEDYVRRESDADLSPDLCPGCTERLPTPGARRGFF